MSLSRELVRKSRYLSRVLRHQPESIGLELQLGGWVSVSQLLKQQNAGLTRDDLDTIVADPDKTRYQYRAHGQQIRAIQGHSTDVQMGYVPAEPPEVLYHGTAEPALLNILEQGLLPMGRQYVHCSSDYHTAQTVGSRHGTVVVLTVAAAEHANAGGVWYRADNGVWLTDAVDTSFLSR